jgi:hypothetical protein
MHVAEIVRDSVSSAQSFLDGLEFAQDSSHSAIGVRPDPQLDGSWQAVVINFDANAENELDEELTATERDPIELYLERHPDTERYDHAA